MPTLKILIIVTAHSALGDTGKATGLWFEELSTPYYMFLDQGAEITIASLPGGSVPIDPDSYIAGGDNPASVARFVKDKTAMNSIRSAKALNDVSPDEYNVIFIPGGHGAMWDLGSSSRLGEFLTRAWAQGIILSSVCHGPAALVNVKETDGRPLVAGKKVNGFTDAEETAKQLTNVVPFMLEKRLRELGADFQAGPDFAPYAVRDGRLMTGQNPSSSEKVAELVLQAVKER